MIYGSGQGIVRKVYDKCSDVHIDKSILTKSKNLLRIELRIKKYAQIPSFPQSAEDLISLEHLKSLSNLVKEFASQLTVSRKLDIEYLWGNHSPNKIIKHLLLGYKDFMEISETIQNSYLPAKQKRLTINTLRKYMEHYPCPKLEGDEGVKVEIQSALEKEIEIFFTNV